MIVEKYVYDLDDGDLLVISSPTSPMMTATFLYCVEAFGEEVVIITKELEHPIWMDWDELFPVWLGVETAPWRPGPI